MDILFIFIVGGRSWAGPKDARHHPMKAMTYQGAMSLSGHDRPAQTVKPAGTRRSRGPMTFKSPSPGKCVITVAPDHDPTGLKRIMVASLGSIMIAPAQAPVAGVTKQNQSPPLPIMFYWQSAVVT
jgi:hypothetical protein